MVGPALNHALTGRLGGTARELAAMAVGQDLLSLVEVRFIVFYLHISQVGMLLICCVQRRATVLPSTRLRTGLLPVP